MLKELAKLHLIKLQSLHAFEVFKKCQAWCEAEVMKEVMGRPRPARQRRRSYPGLSGNAHQRRIRARRRRPRP